MAAIDRILIPTDFSPESTQAFEFAEKIYLTGDIRIDLIHLIPSVIFTDESMREKVNMPNMNEEVYPHLFNEAELRLKKLMKERVPYENRGEIYVKIDRKPAEVIVTHANEGNYSMVLMSAVGKDSSGMFRGSTAEFVVRKCRVPVMTLVQDVGASEISQILIPVDGSMLSMAALPTALKLAHAFGAKITMFYVNEVYGLISNHFSSRTERDKKEEIIDHIYHRMQEYLNETSSQSFKITHKPPSSFKLVSENGAPNQTYEVRVKIVTGFSAHHEITEYANKSADLVVMTTHGRSGLAHILMGSNAEKVALNVSKPILTIRPESKLFNYT